MKNKILMVLLVGLLVPAGIYAQKVYAQGGRAILDMTVAAGMPTSASTDLQKAWIGSPNNGTGPLSYNKADESINAKVYQKLEIAKNDYGTGTSWALAFTGCKGWDHNGSSSGWRLPTLRELQMMNIFKTALDDVIVNDLAGTAFTSAVYWSATENTNTTSWYVDFSGNGYTHYVSTTKSNPNRVRCVREITD